MQLPTYDVAVIGAGFTGSALTAQLTRGLPAGSSILLLGTPKATGKGVAYGTQVPHHLLNVRAGRMSLFPDDPSHFARWLVRGEPAGDAELAEAAESYVPRLLYGRYVGETLDRAVSDAAARVDVDFVESTATEIAGRDGDFVVRAATGIRYAAKAVALCLGHGRPLFPLSADGVDPAARDRMIEDPWSDVRMGRIAADARVLMVGTGLTMVDQVLTLDASGHSGPITAISRHGYLPAGHCPTRTEPLGLDLAADALSLRRLTRAVVAAARAEVAAGRDWRAVVDGLRPVTQTLWRHLDIADRRRFRRHLECIWSVARHRMAPKIAEHVRLSLESGRLTVRAGRIAAVKGTRRGITVGLRARGGRTIELAGFDWMINCSGTGAVVANTVEPPLAQLVVQGLVRSDRLGRGIDITSVGQAVGRTGAPTPGLYALGPMGAGALMEITAVPDIREQCATVARDIADAIARDLTAMGRPGVASGRLASLT